MNKFSNKVIECIGYYVYGLKDPRSNKYFYIGKGCGNRVFQHKKCALNSNDSSLKLDTIREIISEGYDVKIDIFMHGLTENEAFRLESYIINDYWSDLSNEVRGHHSKENIIKSAEEIENMYNCEDIQIKENDKFLALNVNQSFIDGVDIYSKVQGNWTIDPRRASKANYVLIIFNNIVRAMYEIKWWEKVVVQIVSKDGSIKDKNKWIFHKSKEIKNHPYLNKDISKIIKFNQNPVRYYNI